MLKVYSVKYYVSIDGGEWRKLYYGLEQHYELRNEDEPTQQYLIKEMNFDKCYDFLHTHSIPGLSHNVNVWKIPYIRVMYNYDDEETYTQRRLQTISVKRVYTECSYMTLIDIFRRFPADQCVRYLKERGITTGPMDVKGE